MGNDFLNFYNDFYQTDFTKMKSLFLPLYSFINYQKKLFVFEILYHFVFVIQKKTF